MRHAAWLMAATMLAACAGPPVEQRDASDYIVIFELYPDSAGRLQRIAVSRVLDRRSGRTVIELPSPLFVDRARDTLAERTWNVTYERGEIRPVTVRCESSPNVPDSPSCSVCSAC